MNKHLALFLALILFGFASVRAEVAVGCSIEWLTCQAQVVAVGKLASITSVKGPGDVIYEDCVLSISEFIKGPSAKELKFCYRHTSGDMPEWLASKGELLVFLNVYKADNEARLHGLLMPLREHCPFPIFDLSNLQMDAYGKAMTILTNPEEDLDIARNWASSRTAHFVWVPIPPDSPIERALFAGSSVFLKVPAEEKYRAQFMSMAESKDSNKRQKAAMELSKFPGPETERILWGLLGDETENLSTYSGDTIASFSFDVRKAAYRSLKTLGKEVPEVSLERKPTGEERRSLRESFWRKHFTAALAREWKVSTVEDGATRMIENRETTAVTVTCVRAGSSCRFILIPKEWPADQFPKAEALGVYGRNSQGGRHFFLEGTLPDDEKLKLSKYFGLEGN